MSRPRGPVLNTEIPPEAPPPPMFAPHAPETTKAEPDHSAAQPASPYSPAPPEPGPPAENDPRYTVVKVYYATDRSPVETVRWAEVRCGPAGRG